MSILPGGSISDTSQPEFLALSSDVPRKGKIGCHRNIARKNWMVLFGEKFAVPANPDAAEVPTAVSGGSESKEVRAWEKDGHIWDPLASKRNQQVADPTEYSESSQSPAKEMESHPTVQTLGPDDRPRFGTKETGHTAAGDQVKRKESAR